MGTPFRGIDVSVNSGAPDLSTFTVISVLETAIVKPRFGMYFAGICTPLVSENKKIRAGDNRNAMSQLWLREYTIFKTQHLGRLAEIPLTDTLPVPRAPRAVLLL